MLDYIQLLFSVSAGAIAGIISGLIGGFLAQNTAVFIKDATLKIKMTGLETQFDDLESRFNIKYTKLARTVTSSLKTPLLEESDIDQVVEGIDPMLLGLAKSYNIDPVALLSGDPEELKKAQELIEKRGKSGSKDMGL